MKAIVITQQIIDRCARYGLFQSTPVGSIVTQMPQRFHVTEPVSGGYQFRTDLHYPDGWRQVVSPELSQHQRLGVLYFDAAADAFTYTVVDLTPEEIEAASVIVMPPRDFKMALLDNHGITNSHVDALFAALVAADPNMVLPVERMKLMWYESSEFRSNTPELYAFADMMDSVAGISISQSELYQIFVDFKNGGNGS